MDLAIEIEIELPTTYSRWTPLTSEDNRDIRSAIDQGIEILAKQIEPSNFKNTFKADVTQQQNYIPDWWRYRGIRMNFAVLLQKYLV